MPTVDTDDLSRKAPASPTLAPLSSIFCGRMCSPDRDSRRALVRELQADRGGLEIPLHRCPAGQFGTPTSLENTGKQWDAVRLGADPGYFFRWVG